MREYAIKFRPVKPASPHLNGKVERSQRTDLEEFYATVDLNAADLDVQLEDWQDHYNHFRPHGWLNGLTPWEKWQGLARVTPCWDEVEANYDPENERFRHPDYRVDCNCVFSNASTEDVSSDRGLRPRPPEIYRLPARIHWDAGAQRSR